MTPRPAIPGSKAAGRPFAAHVTAILTRPGELLVASADTLLDTLPAGFVASAIRACTESEKPDRVAAYAAALTTSGLATWQKLLSNSRDEYKYRRHQNDLHTLLQAFVLSRPAGGFSDKERALFRAMATLYGAGQLSWTDWRAFCAKLVWRDGNCEVTIPEEHARSPWFSEARKLLSSLLETAAPSHAAYLDQVGATVARQARPDTALGREVQHLIQSGARWLTIEDLT